MNAFVLHFWMCTYPARAQSSQETIRGFSSLLLTIQGPVECTYRCVDKPKQQAARRTCNKCCTALRCVALRCSPFLYVRMQVTPAGDGFYCEFDGKTYDTMERRYVLLLRAADFSGEAYLNMFNEQVHDCSCSPYGVDFYCDRPDFSQLEQQANFTVDAGGCSPLSIS